MKKGIILYIALLITLVADLQLIAGTIDISISQLAVIHPALDDHEFDHGARILVQFDLPDSLASKRILYSEVWAPLPLENLRDTTIAFDLFAISTSWNENEVDWDHPWQNAGGDIDSLLAFRRYFTVGSSDSLNLDITDLSREWTQGIRVNNGFLIAFNFVNRRGLRIRLDQLLPVIRQNIKLRLLFDNGIY